LPGPVACNHELSGRRHDLCISCAKQPSERHVTHVPQVPTAMPTATPSAAPTAMPSEVCIFWTAGNSSAKCCAIRIKLPAVKNAACSRVLFMTAVRIHLHQMLRCDFAPRCPVQAPTTAPTAAPPQVTCCLCPLPVVYTAPLGAGCQVQLCFEQRNLPS